jgi:hypothetical protein
MGFDRTQADLALRASFYHVERAAEYLITVKKKLKILFCILFLFRVTFRILVKDQHQAKEVNQDKHQLVQKVQQVADERVEVMKFLFDYISYKLFFILY